MADNALDVKPRSVTGKNVQKLRRAGITPANVYGHRIESTAVEAATADVHHLLRAAGKNAIVDLKVAGEESPRTVVVRKVDRNPLDGTLLHVDFFQVSMTEKMTAHVPVIIVGTSDAVSTYGGVLLQMVETIEVEALPRDIPSEFRVDVTVLTELEQSIHVRDLHIEAAKVAVLSDPDVVVAKVASPRLAVEETPTAEGAEAAAAAEGAAPGAAAPAEGEEAKKD